MNRYACIGQTLSGFLGALAAFILASSAIAQEKVVIANYGGMVADFYNKYCAAPLKERFRHHSRAGGDQRSARAAEGLRQATGSNLWDMFPAEGEILITATNNGWLEPIDWAVVDPNNEMPAVGRHKYGVAGRVYSMILAYRTDKVPSGQDGRRLEDLLGCQELPGPRAMRDTPLENLEFALIADGVPLDQIYKVLSTPEGVDRAFAKLSEIGPNISVFWTSGQQPAQLLASGEVYYTNTWNGRVVQMKSEKVPVDISWSGGSLNIPFYSIPFPREPRIRAA